MKSIVPNWPAPKHVKAFSSTRLSGESKGVYQGLNLGMHVGDDASTVTLNRELIAQDCQMPSKPVWLNQTHSTHVVELTETSTIVIDADGSVTDVNNVVCSVMTADCLPVLLTNIEGTQVAAVHAGWRGLADGIIEQALQKFDQPENVMAWLGPAIGASAFEVGQDVLDAFITFAPQAIQAFIIKSDAENKWLANMNLLATQRLNHLGVTQIFSNHHCTFSESELFYSYRRDGVTGRQATFIWIE